MNVKAKYISIFAYMCLVLIGVDQATSASGGVIYTARNYRIKRQDGYVYDRPKVSFDLPTATTIAPTQAPTVDRTQMQMYYAYPAPTGGAGDTVNIGYQNTGSSGATSSSTSSGAPGYNYGVQNTGSSGSTSSSTSSGAAGYNYGVQNTQVTATQNTADVGSQNTAGTGYQNTAVNGYQNTAVAGYQNTAVTGTQTVVNSGSTGYGSGRPNSVTNIDISAGVSTNAPRYLPPQTSSNAAVDVSVTTTNQAKTSPTIEAPSESYIPPSGQVSSQQNTQAVSTVQSGGNTVTSSGNVPNTGYLLPSAETQPTLPKPTQTSTVTVLTQPRPVQPVPDQQYLPPVEAPTNIKTQGTVTAPASTYLPPVF